MRDRIWVCGSWVVIVHFVDLVFAGDFEGLAVLEGCLVDCFEIIEVSRTHQLLTQLLMITTLQMSKLLLDLVQEKLLIRLRENALLLLFIWLIIQLNALMSLVSRTTLSLYWHQLQWI